MDLADQEDLSGELRRSVAIYSSELDPSEHKFWADDEDFKEDRQAADVEITRLLGRHKLKGLESQLREALVGAITRYYFWWGDNRELIAAGFGSARDSQKLRIHLAAAAKLMEGAETKNRLQVAAHRVFPEQDDAVRQLPPGYLDDYDAFYKSPRAFHYALERFMRIAEAACFNAARDKGRTSGDVKAAAESLFMFWLRHKDPHASFWTYGEGYDGDGEGSPAFEFVNDAISLIDDSAKRSALKEYATEFDLRPFNERTRKYTKELSRLYQDHVREERRRYILQEGLARGLQEELARGRSQTESKARRRPPPTRPPSA